MESQSVLLALVAVVSACDGSSSSPAKSEAPEPAIRVAEIDEAPTQLAPNSGAVPVEISLVEVRPGDDSVEIEVALPHALPSMSAVRPTLQIGGETTHRSRPGRTGRLDRLVFVVPSGQYARMSKDAEIIVRAGLFTNEAAASKPRLREAE